MAGRSTYAKESARYQETRAQLRHDLRANLFDGPKARSREAILSALLDIVNRQLDEYDRIASRGLRVPGPSLLLLLDQFEEVFRSEVSPDARGSLLNLLADLNVYLAGKEDKGGLFLAVTMRSEELHLCAEHPGLSEVINDSFYLLDLLDPDSPLDRADLHRAIVPPARDVLDDWGLKYDADCPDAPFESGVPDWLLAGAKRSSTELEHRPDQLPLLQHALQSIWHGAMRRWSEDLDAPQGSNDKICRDREGRATPRYRILGRAYKKEPTKQPNVLRRVSTPSRKLLHLPVSTPFPLRA
jgi:hypothetical protein